MIHRQSQDRDPQIVFTSDFHELVQGDLKPGPCAIRYDPLRLIPRAEINDENHHIKANIRFHPLGGLAELEMVVPANAPVEQLADAAGQGFMLEATFNLPAGCNTLEAWFSCTHEDGSVHWDSRMGKNYWLRFALEDLDIKQARVVAAKKKATAQDALKIEITSDPAVDRLVVRRRLTHPSGYPRVETSLTGTVTEGTRKTWSTPPEGIAVPKGATVVFDVVYFIAGHKYTDDNQGRWYVAE